jgi:16S rRNA (uracil1498-N3)-methyltransferase
VNELDFEITVAFGLLTMHKTEDVIDQLTQLGVSRIQPLVCDKSVSRPTQDKIGAKVERWSRLALAAMKQSLRCRLPEITAPCGVGELIDQIAPYDLSLVGSLTGKPIPEINRPGSTGSLLLITGPEEGFTEREEKLLTAAGTELVSLGSRRLRAELAPVALTAAWLSRAQPSG